MKTLWLVRHAKSSWDIEGIDDVDRPLNARGYADAHEMAGRIRKKVNPGLLVSSPAIRAVSTALIFSRYLGAAASQLVISAALYGTGSDAYRAVIASLPDDVENVFLFGHNPVISEVMNLLGGAANRELPTCGIVGISFNENTWKKIAGTTGKLSFLDFPKNKKEDQ